MVIIDDKYKETNERFSGRKPKIGLIKDGVKYIYKYSPTNNEILAELLSEQLGLMCGIDMAHYEYASMIVDGRLTEGVLTPNFLKTRELIIPSNKLKPAAKSIYEENNMFDDLSDNDIDNLIKGITFFDSSIDTNETRFDLLKRGCFYNLIFESDKNETNIAFIKGADGKCRLSPDYDNSSMCALNKNVELEIRYLSQNDIYSYTDKIKCKFHFTDKVDDTFYAQFDAVCQEYPEEIQRIIRDFERIDVEKALSIVEESNKIAISSNVKWFINKLISSRLEDMKTISKKYISEKKV